MRNRSTLAYYFRHHPSTEGNLVLDPSCRKHHKQTGAIPSGLAILNVNQTEPVSPLLNPRPGEFAAGGGKFLVAADHGLCQSSAGSTGR